MRRKIVLTDASGERSARPRTNSGRRTTGSGMMTASGDRPKSSVATTSARPRISNEDKRRISNATTNVRLRISNEDKQRISDATTNVRLRISNARPIGKGSGSSARNKTSVDYRISSAKLPNRNAAIGNRHVLNRNDVNKKTAAVTIKIARPKSSDGMRTNSASVIGNDAAMMTSAGLRISNACSISNAGKLRSNGD